MAVDDRILAAKSGDKEGLCLSVYTHHRDTAGTMLKLIDEYTSESLCEECGIGKDDLVRIMHFIALVHDIGKLTVKFQCDISRSITGHAERCGHYGLVLDTGGSSIRTPHALAGEAILLYMGCPKEIAAIVGGHHGIPAELETMYDCSLDQPAKDIVGYENFYGNKGQGKELLLEIWRRVFEDALDEAGITSLEQLPALTEHAQMIMSGLLIMADWIASNTKFFPLVDFDDIAETDGLYPQRVEQAWDKLGFTERWQTDRERFSNSEFREVFGFVPNDVQREVMEIVCGCTAPGLFIIEAPMGCGKTEAALSAAELLACKCRKNGLFVGLPTQATANGIFPRIKSWGEHQSGYDYHTIQLRHGSAALNQVFSKVQRGIPEDESDSGLIVHTWFDDKKTSCLADFVVATVDQMLMSALKRKHVMLLHLGLAEKVIIIDEVHAYDAYMDKYLGRALEWLGKYKTPVILLSATLPAEKRTAFMKSYLGKKKNDEIMLENNLAYPLVTWCDNGEINQKALDFKAKDKKIDIKKINNDNVCELVAKAVENGACTGIIVNTVKRAQQLAQIIRTKIETADVILYHAQYVFTDRAEKERQILERTGKQSGVDERRGLVVIGTQVLEQSLDIDFDLLITDICPMDLLLQRTGRLHRHSRERADGYENPVCCVITDELTEDKSGSQAVYGRWLPGKTLEMLPDSIVIPQDISPLVQAVYGASDDGKDYENYKETQQELERKAEAFLLRQPDKSPRKKFHNLLERVVNDSEAEASVRYGAPSVEVIVMQCDESGQIKFIPWQNEGAFVSALPAKEEFEKIAMQRLRLPHGICYNIDSLINELECGCSSKVAAWQSNYLLKGQLVMFFDNNMETELAGYKIKYSYENGFEYSKGDDTE